MFEKREVNHKYHSLGFNLNAFENLEKVKGLSNKLNMIFEHLPKCIVETIGDKHDLQKQINAILQTEIQRAAKTQIVDIPVVWLKEGDLLFDYGKKTIERVEYINLYNSRHEEDEKPNTVMVAYASDGDCDNFDIKAKVSIVINPTVSQLINFDYM